MTSPVQCHRRRLPAQELVCEAFEDLRRLSCALQQHLRQPLTDRIVQLLTGASPSPRTQSPQSILYSYHRRVRIQRRPERLVAGGDPGGGGALGRALGGGMREGAEGLCNREALCCSREIAEQCRILCRLPDAKRPP